MPEFLAGLISTTSSVVFIAARISYIRFFTAVHVLDFHISTVISLVTNFNFFGHLIFFKLMVQRLI